MFRYGPIHDFDDPTGRGVDGESAHVTGESFRRHRPIDRTTVLKNLHQDKMSVLRIG
jgi:hypothetical protein